MSGLLSSWQSSEPDAWSAMMADLAQHWGPDGHGDWQSPDAPVRLGRAQLFNTPESALEPPVVLSESCALVWDGRLDSRESLTMGRSPVTDGQLIIEAYRRWGLECLHHLIGSYSFVLWDDYHHQLVAGCDSVGSRPLAYYWNGQTLLISSRVLSLLPHPAVDSRLNEIYLAHTICDLGAHPPGLTAFADIQRLRPGWALILKHGQLSVRSVAPLSQVITPAKYCSEAEAQEAFWHLLSQSIKDRCRSYRPICTTLSGGLDSTTITAGLLQQVDTIEAFSNTTTAFSEFDEREPIQTFLSAFPKVRWHSRNGDQSWPFGQGWETLPVPDDPLVACTMPMNVGLLHKIQEMGFGTVFDGEWGDALFDANDYDLLSGDSLSRQGLSLVWAHLTQQDRWLSWLWHSGLLPRLSSPLQRMWFQRKVRERRANLLPPWLQATYVQTEAVQTALYQSQQCELLKSRCFEMAQLNESIATVGSQQTYRLFQSFQGIEMVSPFADQRLIGFANGLHSHLQADKNYSKIFLRRAVQSVLPCEITWRYKTNHFAPLMYAGLAIGEKVPGLQNIHFSNTVLDSIIDEKALSKALLGFQHAYKENQNQTQYSYRDISKLYSVNILLHWVSCVNNS